MGTVTEESPSLWLFDPFFEIRELVRLSNLWLLLLAEVVEALIDAYGTEAIRWITRCF
jgi:hypothetical protein